MSEALIEKCGGMCNEEHLTNGEELRFTGNWFIDAGILGYEDGLKILKYIKECKCIRENKNLNEIQILTESSKFSNMEKTICIVFKKEDNGLILDENFDKKNKKDTL